MFRGVTFNKQTCKSEDDALIFDTFLNGVSGKVRGCGITFDSENIYISVGYFMTAGRLVNIYGQEILTPKPVETGTQYNRLVFTIDLSKDNTISEFKQGYFEFLSSYNEYPTLTQEDLFNGGYVYQIPIAKFELTVDGIGSFIEEMESVNLNEIFQTMREDLSLYRAQFDDMFNHYTEDFVAFFNEQKIEILKMIQELEDKNFVTVASFGYEIDRVQFGLENKTTVFNSDGSIVETADTYTKTTVFNSDGSISETKVDNLGVVKAKKTVFNSDGSISETVI